MNMIAPAEELSLEEKTDGFVTGVSVVFLMFIALFLEAFVTLLFWRWFVVSLGLKPLAYWHALGLVLFVGFIRHRADNQTAEVRDAAYWRGQFRSWRERCRSGYFALAFYWISGWLVHLLMPHTAHQ